jgi:hypothetical protein
MIGRILSFGLLVAVCGLSGCIAVGGAEHRPAPTKGQELIDLKRALDGGAINQQEYDATRARILDR